MNPDDADAGRVAAYLNSQILDMLSSGLIPRDIRCIDTFRSGERSFTVRWTDWLDHTGRWGSRFLTTLGCGNPRRRY